MDRYIIREMIVPFLAGSMVIALLFDANQLIYILKTFTIQSVPGSAMFQMIVFRTPYWLNFTLPAGISLAASLAITRMTRESEVTALRACGVSVLRILLPIALFGLVVGLGNYYLVEKVIPRAEAKAKRLEIETGIASASPVFNSNVWVTLKNYRATFGTVQRLRDDTILVGDLVLGTRDSGTTTTFTFAKEARYRDGIWTISNPTSYILTTGSLPKITKAEGKVLTINQPIFISDLFEATQPQDKTASELARSIQVGKQAGRDMTKEEIAYHSRFSVPASCIIFALVAPIFSILFARSGSFMGLLLSFVIVLFYYNAQVVAAEVFGRNHMVAPWLAAWLPNFVFVALGLIAIRRLE